jgi:hypothetical protein
MHMIRSFFYRCIKKEIINIQRLLHRGHEKQMLPKYAGNFFYEALYYFCGESSVARE